MDWYNYLQRLNFPVGKLTIGTTKGGNMVLLCSEFHGETGFWQMLDLQRLLQEAGYTVEVGSVKGSWAEAHWNQLMNMAGFEPDDLPF